MKENPDYIRIEDMDITNRKKGKHTEGLVLTGYGPGFIKMLREKTGLDGSILLDSIINNLLVQKGVDWTGTILNEYMGLFKDSSATFSLVWDKVNKKFISHGTVFQSKMNPGVGLVAHIRTHDEFKYLGLGTLVTEKVTKAGFENGAEVIVLATDDKLKRLESGERAAYSLYSKIGYGIIAEKKLADTVDWLMIINEEIYNDCQVSKESNKNKFPQELSDDIKRKQKELIHKTRSVFSTKNTHLTIQKVSDGDLAGLFLLTNLCPANDYRVKLDAWNVHLGPEFERSFVVNIRPAMMDKDRLEDGSMILRDEKGFILAVCAAKQVHPFSRNTMKIDFYCFPEFVENNKDKVTQLIDETLKQIRTSERVTKPCYLSFSGIDETKITIFKDLGFKRTGNEYRYYTHEGRLAYVTEEYSLKL